MDPMTIMSLVASMLPLAIQAEQTFTGPSTGAQKKAFVLNAASTILNTVFGRFLPATPQATIDSINNLAGEAVDMAVNTAKVIGLIKADHTPAPGTTLNAQGIPMDANNRPVLTNLQAAHAAVLKPIPAVATPAPAA